MTEGQAIVSPEVLARYAGDAALEVAGVSALADGPLHRGGAVEAVSEDGATRVLVRLELEWGRSAAEVGGAVQERVAEYVSRMTGAEVDAVDVVFERVSAAPAKR